MVIVLPARSLRDMVRTLWKFEGGRCLARLLFAALVFVAITALPVIGTFVGVYIGADLGPERVAVAAVVTVGSVWAWTWLARRKPWTAVVGRRLSTFEKPNPATEVPVLVRARDAEPAKTALRRAKFNPQVYELRLGSPPSDAPELDQKISVQEPEAWAKSRSDEDRTRRIVRVLENHGIAARVGGSDTRVGSASGARQ